MSKYRVTLYLTYRTPFEVEADNHDKAIEAAIEAFHQRGPEDEVIYAEEITGALVDEDGDEDYEFSRAYYLDATGNWACHG